VSTAEELAARKAERIAELHRLEPGRTALLVIDMQHAFMDPNASLGVPAAWDILPNIQALVAACRKANVPVIFTEFVSLPDIPTLRKDPFGPEHLAPAAGAPTGWGMPSSSCIPGTGGPESPDTVDELKPLPGEPVIRATNLDKFHATPLDTLLRSLDVRHLLVTGILADLCVMATVFRANTLEYRVTVIRDGIATIWPDILTAVLDIYERKLARVVTAKEAGAEVARLAGSAPR
jgi:nicotinamidase-related amidase